MALGNSNVQTESVAAVRTKNANLIGTIFNRLVRVCAANQNVFAKMEGPEGSGKPFVVKDDLKAGFGDRVSFAVMSELGQSPRRGTDELEGYEEHPDENAFSVIIDQVRAAVGYSELLQYVRSTGMSQVEAYATLCGNWLGRQQMYDMMMTLIKSKINDITIRPNRKSTRNALRTADVFSTTLITDAASRMSSRGAKPARIGQSPGTEHDDVLKYVFFLPQILAKPLKTSGSYLTALQNLQIGTKGNPLFDGGYVDWDGHAIKHWDVVDPTGNGPIGAPLLPKAVLGTAITGTPTEAFAVTGSGKTVTALGDYATYFLPFQWFPGYLFKTYSEEVIAADANTYYFVIYDPADGKWNVYSYTGSTGNNGNAITIVNNMAASASGSAVTTLAGQTWSGTLNKEAFPTGSWIIPVNNALCPFGYGFGFGQMAALKAWGKMPITRIKNDRDYGEKKGVGIKALYGQAATLDTDAKPHNYVVFECAVDHEGIYLPVVT